MPHAPTKRRRWAWALLAACVLLVVGLFSWQYRPLTATERRIVGTWKSAGRTGDNPFQIVFASDRRFTESGFGSSLVITGGWHASGDSLTQTIDLLPVSSTSWNGMLVRLRMWWVGRDLDLSQTLRVRFDDPDRMVLGDVAEVLERVRD